MWVLGIGNLRKVSLGEELGAELRGRRGFGGSPEASDEN